MPVPGPFDEAKHPRGQPANAGEFAPRGSPGAGPSATPAAAVSAATARPSPAEFDAWLDELPGPATPPRPTAPQAPVGPSVPAGYAPVPADRPMPGWWAEESRRQGEPEAPPEHHGQYKADSQDEGRAYDERGGAVLDRALDMLRETLGRPDLTAADLADLCGEAPGNNPVNVTAASGMPRMHATIELQVRDRAEGYWAERKLVLRNGKLEVHNEIFEVEKPHRGGGLGAWFFSNQVAKAAELGAESISCLAVRKEGRMNGYWTWARFGYDADLYPSLKAKLPPGLAASERLSDLMMTPEGRDWWKANGETTEMRFDPAEGSLSRRVLDEYRKEKGLPPIAAGPRRGTASPPTTSGPSTSPGTGSPPSVAGPDPATGRHASSDPVIRYADGQLTTGLVAATDPTGSASRARCRRRQVEYDRRNLVVRGDVEAAVSALSGATGNALCGGDLAAICGAPPWSRVGVSGPLRHDGGSRFRVEVRTPEGRTLLREVRVPLDPGGLPEVRNFDAIDPALLGRQAAACRHLGVGRIAATASRRSEGDDGYRLLPGLGFDGDIPEARRRLLPDGLDHCRRVGELMAEPAGRDWWAEHGIEFEATCNTAEESPMAGTARYARDPVTGVDNRPQDVVGTPEGGPQASSVTGVPRPPADASRARLTIRMAASGPVLGRAPSPAQNPSPAPATEAAPATPTEAAASRPGDVRSPQFKSWFGDWENGTEAASKVVHPTTRRPRLLAWARGLAGLPNAAPPREVYHGSPDDRFDRFDPERSGSGNRYGRGIYLSESRDSAAAHMHPKAGRPPAASPGVKHAYVNIRRPFDVDADYVSMADVRDEHLQEAGISEADLGRFRESRRRGMASAAAAEPRDAWRHTVMSHGTFGHYGLGPDQTNHVLRRMGYDGLVFTPPSIGPRPKDSPRTWVAFHPSQVKSSSNHGSFDPGDDRLDYGLGDRPDGPDQEGLPMSATDQRPGPRPGQLTTPKLSVQAGPRGPRLVRYAGSWEEQKHPRGKPENAGEFRSQSEIAASTPAARASSAALLAPSHMVIGGMPHRAGDEVHPRSLAGATPQQLAALGLTPQQAAARLAGSGHEQSPHLAGQNEPGVPPGGRSERLTVTMDMVPEDMRKHIHLEDLAQFDSPRHLQEFVGLFRAAVDGDPNSRLPTARELKALAIAGKSVRGHYRKFQERVNKIFGLEGGKMFTLVNAVLSANTGWEEHTVGAFTLVGEWMAAGKPRGQALKSMLSEWSNQRKANGSLAYAQFFRDKRQKIFAILSDPARADLKQVARGGWGKTPEFGRAFFDAKGIPIDTHMAKVENADAAIRGALKSASPEAAASVQSKIDGLREQGADVTDIASKVAGSLQDPHRYAAFKALHGHVAQELGWEPSEVQEAAWSTVLAVALMKKHGFTADNVGEYLSHGTVAQNWDMNGVFRIPEVQNALVDRLEVPRSLVESYGAAGPGEGGPAGEHAAADPVGTPDPAALRSVADRIPAARNKAALGIRLTLPKGKDYPAGTRPQTPEEVEAGRASVGVRGLRPGTPEELAESSRRDREYLGTNVAEARAKRDAARSARDEQKRKVEERAAKDRAKAEEAARKAEAKAEAAKKKAEAAEAKAKAREAAAKKKAEAADKKAPAKKAPAKAAKHALGEPPVRYSRRSLAEALLRGAARQSRGS